MQPRLNGKPTRRQRKIGWSRKPSSAVWRQRRSVKRTRSVLRKRSENGLRKRPNGGLRLMSRGGSTRRGAGRSRKSSKAVWKERRSVKRRKIAFGQRNENGLAMSFATN